MSASNTCPRHAGAALVVSAHPMEALVCPEGGGCFLPAASVRTVVETHLGFDAAQLPYLPAHTDRGRITCPGCGKTISAVLLKGLALDFCVGCHGMWFDKGELESLTGGKVRFDRPAPRPDAERSTAPDASFGKDGDDLDLLPDVPNRGPQRPREQLVRTASPEPSAKGGDEPYWDDEPHAMVAGLNLLLTSEPVVTIEQLVEWAEVLVGWEQSNRYYVADPMNRPLAHIFERSHGLSGIFKRLFLGSKRPLDVDVLNHTHKQILLELRRPFSFLFSDLEVSTPTNRKLGSVHRRFGLLYRRFDLRGADGEVFATISGPLWKIWTFPVLDLQGESRSVIRKRWSGLFKEAMSDADKFEVELGSHPWTLAQRCVIFAAAISIDFDFFENNQQRGVRSLFGA